MNSESEKKSNESFKWAKQRVEAINWHYSVRILDDYMWDSRNCNTYKSYMSISMWNDGSSTPNNVQYLMIIVWFEHENDR